jgi:hypothetical protein
MLARIVKTVRYVLTNPNRSLPWKVADSVFLAMLFGLVLVSLIETLFEGASLDWFFLNLLLLPWVFLVTQRSWYELPRAPRERAQRLAQLPPVDNVGGDADSTMPVSRAPSGWDLLGGADRAGPLSSRTAPVPRAERS